MTSTPENAGPYGREEILAALEDSHREGNVYWSAFPDDRFFAPIGDAWSPSENVRHLIKSSRPLIKALGMPRIAMRLMFGKSTRTSVTFEQLKARYLAGLEGGGKAGAFTPSADSATDLTARRQEIMEQRKQVHEGLVRAARRWSESQVDRYQLPHPLLGPLTVREMLMFTIYHQGHHREVVARRLAGGHASAD